MPFDDTIFFKQNAELIQFFGDLTDDQLRELTAVIERDTYDSGRTVLFQGEMTHNFYIVKRGRVTVTARDPKQKDKIILAELKAGDFFGEISLLEATTATATIKVVEDGTEILTIPRDAFQNLLREAPHLEGALRRRIAARKEQKTQAFKKPEDDEVV
jgi:CRP/FNR family transcriptional regulator, cyclic AMP receptor protein